MVLLSLRITFKKCVLLLSNDFESLLYSRYARLADLGPNFLPCLAKHQFFVSSNTCIDYAPFCCFFEISMEELSHDHLSLTLHTDWLFEFSCPFNFKFLVVGPLALTYQIAHKVKINTTMVAPTPIEAWNMISLRNSVPIFFGHKSAKNSIASSNQFQIY